MGKAVKSNSYHSILLPQTRSNIQRSILSCLFPSSLWEMTYRPTKCHSLRLVILCPVRQLASDMLQVRHVISSCLDSVLTVEEMPPPLTSVFGFGCQVLLSPWLSPAAAAFTPRCPLGLFLAWQSLDWVKRITFTRKITGDSTHLLSTFSAKVSETENFNSFTKRCAVAVVRLIYNPHDFM